ncbi:hypothetical protein QMZ92_19760 [Streptomyces sp. HNM0645]|uniref:hypothetical protein n=1 Tax=Streptomyces sp. HNM0645 TaxID=2782343 RepID=UPI0024B63952|nr:hypothetical protein [Streptomyces sp. HNM0645]MDI9886552.1 hypothetical protein [Streptomyces sp. HNM0645]
MDRLLPLTGWIAAHHRDTDDDPPKAYPQLCLGFELDTPTVRTGPNAVNILTQLTGLGLPPGILAADRAYTNCTPATFQTPVRRLGYRLALDYKVIERGRQGSWQGAPLVDGSLMCPLTPAPLIQATSGAADDTIRAPGDELAEKIEAREPYHFKLKQGPDARGAIRLQCPASGPSPSVNCARRDRLRPRTPATMPTRIVDLTAPRDRTAHTAARPTIQIPDAEHFAPPPKKTLPEVCCAGSITVPADAEAADWRLAKYRQDVHYLHTTWINVYRPIRSHNEGAKRALQERETRHRQPQTPARPRASHPGASPRRHAHDRQPDRPGNPAHRTRRPRRTHPRRLRRQRPPPTTRRSRCHARLAVGAPATVHPLTEPAWNNPTAPKHADHHDRRASPCPEPGKHAQHARHAAPPSALPTSPETTKSRPIEVIGRDLVNRLRANS